MCVHESVMVHMWGQRTSLCVSTCVCHSAHVEIIGKPCVCTCVCHGAHVVEDNFV